MFCGCDPLSDTACVNPPCLGASGTPPHILALDRTVTTDDPLADLVASEQSSRLPPLRLLWKGFVCCRKLAAMGGVMAENLLDEDSPRAIAPDSEYAKDEAGTAPGDRAFRRDVEGLRAVAILTVILYHAHVPPFTGGYIGIDVFFVISGFVITGVLLRERSSTGSTSLLRADVRVSSAGQHSVQRLTASRRIASSSPDLRSDFTNSWPSCG